MPVHSERFPLGSYERDPSIFKDCYETNHHYKRGIHMKIVREFLILLLVGAFFIGTNPTASAAESWAADPKTGCRIAWVSDSVTLVSASWTGPTVNSKAEGKGSLTVTIRDQAGKENNGQADAQMKAGLLNGKVSIQWSDKSSFDGLYKDGLREGKGIFKFSDGTLYEGDFKSDKCTGKGVMKFTNGEVYAGDFRDGKLNGYGVLKDPGGKVIYEGQWKDGQRGTGQDISDEVRKHLNWGKIALETAKTSRDIEDAMEEFNIAIKLAPDCADAYYRLGVVQEMINKNDDAMKNLKKYLELAPDGATVKEAKQLIDKLEYKAYKNEKAMKGLGESAVLIPAGEFMMGSSKGETNEHPAHKVFLDAYYINKQEVTVAQYRQYCSASGKAMPPAPPWGWQDSLPIGNVTWEDANAFAQFYGKRLPTEAEWEKAARADSATKYFFGDSPSKLGDYTWYKDNSNEMVHPVATKEPNAFGLYDIYGNAAEWCSDWYGADYYKHSPASNPTGPGSGPYHVVRGGNYHEQAVFCYSSFRYNFDVASFKGEVRGWFLGFRCASSIIEPGK